MKFSKLLRISALLLLTSASGALAATVERLSVVSNGEVVGTVIGTTDGNRTEVSYAVDDNGRGPRLREEIVLGENGIPVRWSVTGRSLMGGVVEERYAWEKGRAAWTSQADAGDVEAASPPLYILNDTSPWAEGVYARAALAAKDNRLAVLPAGVLRLTKVRDLTVGAGAKAVAVTAYRLDGVQLEPGYLLLDGSQRLFATFDARSATVREGYEAEVPQLAALGTELETERMQALQQQLAHRFDAPVRIRNVHVFDPRTGKRGPLATVVVMRDRITQVLPENGEATPADQVEIDGAGGTVYPGLHDMHSHTTLQSGLFYLAAGVTGTRDLGNNNTFLQNLLPRLEAGEIAGPRIVPTGFLEGRSPYSARHGIVAASQEEAVEAVRWYADRGYAQIKIYNSLAPEWVKPVADEAHRLGLRVTGHVPAFSNPDRVIADGYSEIAHVNQLMLGWILGPEEDTRTPLRLTAMARGGDLNLKSARVRKTIGRMKKDGIALDPTALILERLMLSRAGEVNAGDADYLNHMPIAYQRYRKRSFVTIKSAEEDQAYQDGFAKVLDVLATLHREGIQLLPGTDDTTGFTVHRELELYTKAGIPAAEALRLGTLASADYLGKAHERGTIEQGKLADFVLVAGDPTQDIREIKKARMVLKGGAIYFPAEIYSALGIKPFASAPQVKIPAAAGSAD